MNAAEKIARQESGVLQRAEALGNITAACRQRVMHRSRFYEYKRHFQTHGLEGLKPKEKNSQKAIELTGEQVAFAKKTNLAFKERHMESSRPGKLLCQDTF